MTDLNEILEQLSQARETYNEYVAAVDSDLKKERQRRLAVRQGEILDYVAKAYAMGASKRAIMRAYRTKDFRTIDSMIETMEEQIALIKQEIEAENNPVSNADWFSLMSRDFAYIGEEGYEITELDGEEYLLIQVEGQPTPWDGFILSDGDDSDPNINALWSAIKRARNS